MLSFLFYDIYYEMVANKKIIGVIGKQYKMITIDSINSNKLKKNKNEIYTTHDDSINTDIFIISAFFFKHF